MSTETSRESDPRLTLLVRIYCLLCFEMRQALGPVLGSSVAALDVFVVDGDRELEARWGDKIPVLLTGERELCHYRLDRTLLAAWLADMLR